MAAPPVVDVTRRLGLSLGAARKLGVDEFVSRLRALAPEVAVVVAFAE